MENRPILISGELPANFGVQRFICWTMAVIGLAAAYTPGGDWTLGWIFAASGAALGLMLECRALWKRMNRRWVEIRPDGFVVSRRGERRDYGDGDVDAVAYASYLSLVNGSVEGTVRRFKLWLCGAARPLTMENRLAPGARDPLQELIDRLIDAAVARAEEQLRQGGAIEGANWRLDSAALHADRARPIALSDLSAVEERDGNVCVWRRGESNAALKIRVDGRNAAVLLRVLRTRLAERPEREAAAGLAAGALGRVLFERRTGYIPAEVLLGIAALLAGGGLFTPGPLACFLVGLVFAGAGGATLVMRGRTFRCYEGGVAVSSVLSQHTLAFADVDAFTYQAVRRFRNDRYVGTKVSMHFRPRPQCDAQPLTFAAMFYGRDRDLDRLRDFISVIIARQMHERFDREGSVAWTPALTFFADGLEYRPNSVPGEKAAQIVPYARCERWEFAHGTFNIFSPGCDQPIVSEQTSAANFFPGYFLLHELTTGQASRRSPA